MDPSSHELRQIAAMQSPMEGVVQWTGMGPEAWDHFVGVAGQVTMVRHIASIPLVAWDAMIVRFI